MPVDQRTLDNAVSRLLQNVGAERIGALVSEKGELWDALPMSDRFAFGMFKREIREVLGEVSAFHVLAAIQRIRPDLVEMVGTPDGLRWLGGQVASLKQRALA